MESQTTRSSKREMESEALPADMLFEILSRASFETIERSKAVSKGLRQMIYDPSFLPLHCKRTNSVFGYFFQTIMRNKCQSEFVSDDDHGGAASINESWPRHDHMRILASCDQGILCCEKLIYKKERYYVCKPATKQWQALPNPKLRYQTAAVAVVLVKSRPLRYNIVRLSWSRVMNYNCEIFDSENWAWEKTQGPNMPYQEIITPHKAAITVGESVHWLTSNNSVLTFNVKERSFRCFSLPEPVHYNNRYGHKQLMKYEGNVGLSWMAEDRKRIELWVVEGRRRCGWTRKMVVDIKFIEKTLLYPNLVDFCSSDIAFMKTVDGAVFCNFGDCSFSRVEVPYHIRDVQQIFRFQSDLESVHLIRSKILKQV